ncbi:unnamed protein product [Brassica napus]|uniref:(rape) hypothetical protein n=1 Tax=Brassica napus TaxID=3708 RepID=A0A816UC39_BRANA|nr:unnamed protein product [Brassica napus]
MDQNDKKLGNSSTPADSGDLPSDEILPATTNVPPLQGTDSGTGTKSNSNGSDTKNEVEANREEKLVEKEAKSDCNGGPKDKRSPEDVLKEMQMQRLMISTGPGPHFLRTGTAHDLYCPNCTHNITRTAELFEKGKEKFQYNNENIILSFVIVVSFKYPFIFLPWFYNNTPDEPAPSVVSETPKKHVPAWLRFVLVVVLLLLSALVLLWIPPSPSPLSPSPIPPPTPHTNGNDKPIWPSPSTIVNKGGLVHFYWVKYLPSSRVLYVISLLLLAVLALFWPSMTRTKGTEPEGKADLPNEKEVLGDKEGVPSLIGGLSTPGNKTNGSERAKEIPPPHVAPQPTTFAKILSILRQHIVVPVHNVLQTELDILKSIVYGGLIESITSFGVVSSAAASGTSTLNVMALGLANLFSGLFLIIYNLYGLVMSEPFFPHAHIDNATDMKDKIDPYEQMLGNRNNVALHCIVVVVSFIFFGVIPPLFYGFSFKTTDNRYYEAAVFVAASLLCVITLSFGKAHAFKKDKLKTVAVYTGIAIGASAFSCIASQHVRGLLEKYEFHKIASD